MSAQSAAGRRLQQIVPAGEYVLAIQPELRSAMAATLSLQPVLPLPAGFIVPKNLPGYEFVALPTSAVVTPPPGALLRAGLLLFPYPTLPYPTPP